MSDNSLPHDLDEADVRRLSGGVLMSSRWRRHRRASLLALGIVTAVAIGGVLAATASSKSNAVTISIIEHQPPRVALLKKMLPLFEKTHPNIKVKLIEGPAVDTDFQNKMTLDFSSGHAADVVALSFDPADVASSGYLLNLTSLVNKWSGWKRFYPTLRKGEVHGGKIYTIPREATVQQFFYRKDVLRKAGISTAQPTTWAQFMSRLQAASKALNGPSIVFPAGKQWGGGSYGESFINVLLGTKNTLYDTKTNKWVVRSPGLTQTLGLYEQMTSTGVLDIPPLLNPEPWVATKYQAFAQGKLAVSTGGTWSWFFDWGPKGSGPIPNVFKSLGVWNYPTFNGGTYVAGGTGWRWAISAKTKHPNEAWTLVKWLAGPQFIAQNAVTIGAVSPRNDVRVAPYTKYPVLISSERQLPKAKAFNPPAGVDKIIQVVDDVTEQIITKKITTASDAADAFAKEAKDLLGGNKVEEIGG
jgi:multiple sugar transport system substrate-binding protein